MQEYGEIGEIPVVQQSSLIVDDQTRRRSMVRNAAVPMLGILAVLILFGYGGVDFGKPLVMGGDSTFLLRDARSYANGDGMRFITSLGYPGVLDRLTFPTFDFSHQLILWIFARASGNPFVAVHILYVCGIVAMFMAAYWTLAMLGTRHWFAMIAAVAYIISPFFAARAGGHGTLALYFSAPLGCYLALKVGLALPNAPIRDFFREPMVLIALVAAAVGQIYYAFFSAMFIAFIGASTAIAEMTWRRLAIAAILTEIIYVLLIVTGLGFGLIDIIRGTVVLPSRLPFEQALYGLVIAGAMRTFEVIPFLREGATAYTAFAPGSEGDFGEWPGVFLTLVILTSPLIALVAGWVNTRSELRAKLIFLSAISIVFGLVFAQRYGLGFIFHAYVTPAMAA